MEKKLLRNNILGLFILILLLCQLTWDMPAFYPSRIAKLHLLRTCTSDEAAIQQAVKDLENGKITIIVHGLMDVDFANKIEEKSKKYGFQAIGFGCMGGTKPMYLYDQIMKRAINEKAQKFVFRTFDTYTLSELKKRSTN
jgi:hypothetical protein